MSYFRIYIYLTIRNFIKSVLFSSTKQKERKIEKIFNKTTNKKFSFLTSQLRVGFVLVLKYLTKKFPTKNAVIVNSYNLGEMVNICHNFKLKIVFTKLNKNVFINSKDLLKKINKNTLAVVVTNIFNNQEDILKVKNICQKKKIILIEDNAIYFGNYFQSGSKKIYSGSFGDYSLHSFNIMKNISGMFGGLVSTNDKYFIKFAVRENESYRGFPYIKYFNQIIVFFILKIFSIQIFYKSIFFHLIKKAHKKNQEYILKAIYPSLKFDKKSNFKSYLYKINSLTVNMVYEQLQDFKSFLVNYKLRMSNNLYYEKLFTQCKIKNLEIIKIRNKTFQNFNEYPIIINDKNRLKNYLFDKGIETKMIQYVDCQKIFKNKNKKDKLDSFENKILCLPNHKNISKKYISYIVNNIKYFYNRN